MVAVTKGSEVNRNSGLVPAAAPAKVSATITRRAATALIMSADFNPAAASKLGVMSRRPLLARFTASAKNRTPSPGMEVAGYSVGIVQATGCAAAGRASMKAV